MKRTYSTAEVAKKIKVSKITLLRWLWEGRIPEPERREFGGVSSRIWTYSDLTRAKQFREENYHRKNR